MVIVLLLSFSVYLLLVYKKATGVYILILYLAPVFIKSEFFWWSL
jgi:hypothetical protein